MEGYATTFTPYVLYEDEGEKVWEQISKSAFDNCKMNDVILQFDHEGRVYARQSNGTLGLEVTDNGLLMWADLSKTASARALYEEIKSGLITKMSWRFMLAPDGRTYDPIKKTIYINRVSQIFDVSAVSIPANNGTSITARKFVESEMAAETEKQAVKERRIKRLRLLTEI